MILAELHAELRGELQVELQAELQAELDVVDQSQFQNLRKCSLPMASMKKILYIIFLIRCVNLYFNF